MAANPIELRPYTPEHLPELTDLWVESWRQAMPEIDFEERRGWLIGHLGALIEAGSLIELAFAEPDGASETTLAGFVTIDCSNGQVDQLVVHPRHWGRGVAEALIYSAAAHAGRPITLEVNRENLRAVRFYGRIGFNVTGQGENPLSGRPTLQMEWRPGFLLMERD
jgi:putative acetyltransferase